MNKCLSKPLQILSIVVDSLQHNRDIETSEDGVRMETRGDQTNEG